MRWILLAGALAGAACSTTVSPAQTRPVYVVLGDSIALGEHWPAVRAALPPHTWINAAIGGTTIWQWAPPDGMAWGRLLPQIAGQTPIAFLVHLGANDTVKPPPPTEAAVFGHLQALTTGLRELSPTATIYLAEVGQVWTYGDRRADNAVVRAAIQRAWRELAGVRAGPLLQDLTPDDGVHFESAANIQTIADRWLAILSR